MGEIARALGLSAGATLVVDDEVLFRMTLATLMRARGQNVIEAADGVEALERLQLRPVQALVVDLEMPRLGGVELLAELHSRGCVARVYVVSAYVSRSDSCGVSIWPKPVDIADLMDAVTHEVGSPLSLKTVVVSAAASGRSNILSMTYDDGSSGRIWVTGGRIAAAESSGPTTLSGTPAAIDLLARPARGRVKIEQVGGASIDSSFRSQTAVGGTLSEVVWTAKAYGSARGWGTQPIT